MDRPVEPAPDHDGRGCLPGCAAAGFLAGTLLRGMHADLAGIVIGPLSAIFGVSALLIISAGLAMVSLLRGADTPSLATLR
jgi:hypothetical protein